MNIVEKLRLMQTDHIPELGEAISEIEHLRREVHAWSKAYEDATTKRSNGGITMIMAIMSWRHMLEKLPKMDEEMLREAINYEVATYKRKLIITRLHQRYSRLRANRERQLLLSGEHLL